MSDPSGGGRPRRDADGRVTAAVDLLGQVLAGLVIGVAVLVLFDLIVVLLDRGRFGGSSGWLAAILPVWLFVEEYRSWRTGQPRPDAQRVVVALAAAVVGGSLGLLAAGAAGGLPALVTGGLGATVACVAYAVIWFYGIRRSSRPSQRGGRP